MSLKQDLEKMMKNRAYAFVVLLYALTALYSWLYLAFPIANKDFVAFAITAGYMGLPFVTVIILTRFVYKQTLSEVGIVFKWSFWLIPSALMPWLLALMAFGISLALPDVSFDPTLAAFIDKMRQNMTPEQYESTKQSMESMKAFFLPFTLLQAFLAGVTVNALFSFGEESGWRGFLLEALKDRGFLYTSVFIGVAWGLWHTPVILQGHNYPDHRLIGVFMMTAFTVLLTPIMIYFTRKSGSVLAASFFHGVLNASAGLPLMYIDGGNDLTVGLTGAAGLTALLVVDAGIIIYDRYFAKTKVTV